MSHLNSSCEADDPCISSLTWFCAWLCYGIQAHAHHLEDAPPVAAAERPFTPAAVMGTPISQRVFRVTTIGDQVHTRLQEAQARVACLPHLLWQLADAVWVGCFRTTTQFRTND
jgi:hypothetical protein